MNSSQQLDMIKFINDNSINNTHNLLIEATQTQLTDVVLDKLFELTVGKYSKIDFSDIERSRGDITKIKYYNNLRDCIDVLLDIHTTTDKIPGALVVSTALSNFLVYKKQFEHAFRVKNTPAIMIYNTFMYCIMEATSYLIATSIDFVKDGDTYKVNVYTDSKQSMMINQLVRFNKIIDDGTLLKFIGETEKAAQDTIQEASFATDLINKGVGSAISKGLNFVKAHPNIKKGALVVGATAGILWLSTIIVPLIREVIYLIYKTRQKISDAARIQAEFLEANIEILKKDGADEKIIARQEKHVKIFLAIARVFSLESDKAQRDAKKEIQDDKVDVSSVVI